MAKLPPKDRRAKGADGKSHKMSPVALNKAMQTERRFDEYLRLREIRQQNAMWYRTVAISLVLNVLLLAFAWVGAGR